MKKTFFVSFTFGTRGKLKLLNYQTHVNVSAENLIFQLNALKIDLYGNDWISCDVNRAIWELKWDKPMLFNILYVNPAVNYLNSLKCSISYFLGHPFDTSEIIIQTLEPGIWWVFWSFVIKNCTHKNPLVAMNNARIL